MKQRFLHNKAQGSRKCHEFLPIKTKCRVAESCTRPKACNPTIGPALPARDRQSLPLLSLQHDMTKLKPKVRWSINVWNLDRESDQTSLHFSTTLVPKTLVLSLLRLRSPQKPILNLQDSPTLWSFSEAFLVCLENLSPQSTAGGFSRSACAHEQRRLIRTPAALVFRAWVLQRGSSLLDSVEATARLNLGVSWKMKGNLETSQPAVSSSIQQSARSYKDMLFQRIEQAQKKGKGNIQWIDYNFEMLKRKNTGKYITKLM